MAAFLEHDHAARRSADSENHPTRPGPSTSYCQSGPCEQERDECNCEVNLPVHPERHTEEFKKKQCTQIGLAGEISRLRVGEHSQKKRSQNRSTHQYTFGNALSHALLRFLPKPG